MANAKQCDRCNKYFLPLKMAYNIGACTYIGRDTHVRCHFYEDARGELDLCRDCTARAVEMLLETLTPQEETHVGQS